MPNFQNFNKSDENPAFAAKFLIEDSELIFDDFLETLTSDLDEKLINQNAIEYDPNLAN